MEHHRDRHRPPPHDQERHLLLASHAHVVPRCLGHRSSRPCRSPRRLRHEPTRPSHGRVPGGDSTARRRSQQLPLLGQEGRRGRCGSGRPSRSSQWLRVLRRPSARAARLHRQRRADPPAAFEATHPERADGNADWLGRAARRDRGRWPATQRQTPLEVGILRASLLRAGRRRGVHASDPLRPSRSFDPPLIGGALCYDSRSRPVPVGSRMRAIEL